MLFSSDFHGNSLQLESFLNKSREYDFSIIGGDTFPNLDGNLHENLQEQKEFIRNYFIPTIKSFNSPSRLFILPGNDDWKSSFYLLKEFDGVLFEILTETKKYRLMNNLFITGYPFVPLSRFMIKDWEKFDLNEDIDDQYTEGYQTYGLESIERAEIEGSIEEDMETLFSNTDPKKTIYIMHSPPFNTPLDIIKDNNTLRHVGSKAIIDAIERYQPFLTLHGHIHESCDLSKIYKTKINNTISASVCNNPYLSEPRLLSINLPDLVIRRD